MQDISCSGFDKLIFVILLFLGPLCSLFLLILGVVQMGKRSSWMTRFCYGLSIVLIAMSLLVIMGHFANSHYNPLFGGMIISFVIFSSSAYGFKMKLNGDK